MYIQRNFNIEIIKNHVYWELEVIIILYYYAHFIVFLIDKI